MKYAFIKDSIVIGVSKEPTGIPDYDMVCGVEDVQVCDVGFEVVNGAFVDANSVPSYCLSKLKFMNKFTLTELAGIELKAETDPIVKVLQRQQAIADFIDIKDPKTAEGIGYLVSIGVITPERMTQILSVE